MTHSDKILRHMQTHGSITAAEAIERFGCYRLGARIYDLRQRGHKIVSIVENGKNRDGDPVHYARYRLT